MSFNAKFTDNEGFLYHAQIRSANAIEHSDTGSSTITTALAFPFGGRTETSLSPPHATRRLVDRMESESSFFMR